MGGHKSREEMPKEGSRDRVSGPYTLWNEKSPGMAGA